MLRRMLKMAEPRLKRTLPLLLTVALGPTLFGLGGCAYGQLKQVLRAQVAAETDCGDVTIESSPLFQPGYQPNQYRVRGCGIDRTYNCPRREGLVSYSDKSCTYVDTKSIKPPDPMPSASSDPDPALEEPLEPEPPADEPPPAEEPPAEPTTP